MFKDKLFLVLLAVFIVLLVWVFSSQFGFWFDRPSLPDDYQLVKVYFSNSVEDPNTMDCEKVYPAIRSVPVENQPVPSTGKTEGAELAQQVYLTIRELLAGPTDREKDQGFYTSINSGTELRSIIIEKGLARVDLSDRIEFELGGSCRVMAIRSQITETMKQFTDINEVLISVEGRTDGVLQP